MQQDNKKILLLQTAVSFNFHFTLFRLARMHLVYIHLYYLSVCVFRTKCSNDKNQ